MEQQEIESEEEQQGSEGFNNSTTERRRVTMSTFPGSLSSLTRNLPHNFLIQQTSTHSTNLINAFVNTARRATIRSNGPEENNDGFFNVAIDINTRPVTIDMNADNTGGTNEEATSNSTSTQENNNEPVAEAIAIFASVKRYLPFLIILLCKTIHDYGIGLLVFMALFFTFSYSNNQLKREVTLQGRRSLRSLASIVLYAVSCISLLYTVFEEENLFTNLWLLPQLSVPLILADLLWMVIVTDFVLKLITIIVKSLVASLPGKILAFPRRGSVFLVIEVTSQLYRALVPLQPWIYFLISAYQGLDQIFGAVLSIAYFFFKCKELFSRFSIWKEAAYQALQHSPLGCIPSEIQMAAAGPMCTICHESFTSPVCLPCNHVFCEGCLSAWADREPSCPLCRAKFGTDPAWRDGATTFFIQFF